MFTFATKSLWQVPSTAEPPIPQQEPVDEELCPGYTSASFYPANPGEVLAERFQLLVKVGWGSQSTVWLARDIARLKWQSERTVVLKIINSNNADNARHEKEIESHITQQNPEHHRRVILRTCLDDVEVTGPEGRHMCLVYEPMREPIWILQRRFVDRKIHLPIAKAYIYFLLAGLDYLHSECNVVHSDLKLDNILMSFENENILTNFINRKQQMQYKIDGKSGRTIYRCHNDFGPLDGRDIKNMVPKIADFGLATRLDKPDTRDGMVGKQLGIYPIQPDYYRAPEVILGCGWDFKADIWNFGLLLWNILGSQELFQQVYDADGKYDAKSHLAEMIALLGPPPKALLAKSKTMSEHDWPQPVANDTGKLCNNAQEFFDGPFFDAEDKFRHNGLIPSRSLENTAPFLEQEDREAFLSFVRQMLNWLPEERKTARELMDHQFLKLGG
ncbi:putative serine/threonine-protein kinase [Aspergillus fischeri NRRL 181]|uniref:non-specific serine/threonine protein kinase n=1 Tax=Neosartorya fischeri (strain ATCC 1020 / DSM 3700 / CBS 544.65 / FGSC A1164 / JCM 1740 / NRRL 181 / WB 181) TaxID=331117 RepID=A1CVG9_NEOFI|nr:serine/threonine-protein kinase, putative [Aspergillus fischeri NRRL 181]EAW25746.1 serine/threonine-protein kinase, putative [Aspergillus fischeri NRRL 181]